MLLYDTPGVVTVSNCKGANMFSNVQVPVYVYNASAIVDGVEVGGGATLTAVIAANAFTSALARRVDETLPSRAAPLEPAPFGGRDETSSALTVSPDGTLGASFTVNVTNSCFYGSDAAGSFGIESYSAGGGMDVTATHNVLQDWDTALVVDGPPATLTAHENSITSSVTAGFDASASPTQNAERNWWGDAAGPSGGNGVTGADYEPWIHSGANLAGDCGFDPPTYTITASAGGHGSINPTGALTAYQGDDVTYAITPDPGYVVADVVVDAVSMGALATYTFAGVTEDHTIAASFVAGGDDVVAPVATACITPARPCLTVPVNLTRTSTTGLRLFHVVFTLSPELKLCDTPGNSLLEGTYLSGFGAPTSFFVLDDGDGTYTADGTIVGPACGPAGGSGTLFSIRVTSRGSSGTGTLTVTQVILRDCLNQDITPAVACGVAEVPIDDAPVTVTPIHNTQVVAELATLTVTPEVTLTGCASGPVAWTITPPLPVGANLDPATGVITWTPDSGAAEAVPDGLYGVFTLRATVAGGDVSWTAFSILVTNTPLAVDDVTPGRLSLAVSPNPGRGSVVFTLAGARAGAGSLTVRDVQGRRVCRFVPGGSQVTWDGRHELGQSVPNGTYFATLEAEGRSVTVRFGLLH